MSEIYDLEMIQKFLPHRKPMLLIDRVEVEADKRKALAFYTIKENEFFTQGHFPENPIVPGVIQCEMMAQACAFTVKDKLPGHITLYSGIEKARFKKLIRPGDTCEIHAVLDEQRESDNLKIYYCSSKICVNGKLCSMGKLSFALVPSKSI